MASRFLNIKWLNPRYFNELHSFVSVYEMLRFMCLNCCFQEQWMDKNKLANKKWKFEEKLQGYIWGSKPKRKYTLHRKIHLKFWDSNTVFVLNRKIHLDVGQREKYISLQATFL